MRQPRVGRYRDLDVYRRAFVLVRPAYELTGSLPAVEKHDLARQMRRAANSIPAHLAEGYAMPGDAPTICRRHLKFAFGSAVEMQAHVDPALEFSCISAADRRRLRDEYEVLGKMLYRPGRHWRKQLPVRVDARGGVPDD